MLILARRAAVSACLLAAAHWRPPLPALARPDKDGIFSDCSGFCVSSQDDRPAVWDNPWVAEQALPSAMERLRRVIELKLQGKVVEQPAASLGADEPPRGRARPRR